MFSAYHRPPGPAHRPSEYRYGTGRLASGYLTRLHPRHHRRYGAGTRHRLGYQPDVGGVCGGRHHFSDALRWSGKGVWSNRGGTALKETLITWDLTPTSFSSPCGKQSD